MASTSRIISGLRWTTSWRLSDDEEHEVRNLQLLCPYCNRVKGTQGSQGFRMKMTELRAHNAATGVMVDEREADLTGRRLAQYHLEGWECGALMAEGADE